ncbi:MAG TPA: hypothetical protein VF895_02565 [Gaiellaceae bacterium]
MKTRIALALGAGVLGLAVSLPALSAPPKAVNLIATPRVKSMLRAAFILKHHQYSQRRIKGPLKGTTYYGRYGRTEYAFSVFSVPRTGTTDQPELFKRAVNGIFRDLGDTGGEICKRDVPLALIKVWRLKHSSPGCFVAP